MNTEKEYYKEQLIKTLVYAAISFTAFTSVFATILNGAGQPIFLAFVAGVCYAGVPCGWSITGKAFGDWYITGTAGILVFVLRLMLAVVIGVFALPIQIVVYCRKFRTASNTAIMEEV